MVSALSSVLSGSFDMAECLVEEGDKGLASVRLTLISYSFVALPVDRSTCVPRSCTAVRMRVQDALLN